MRRITGELLRHYKLSMLALVAVYIAVGISKSPTALGYLTLVVLVEFTFSFDNAIVNAKILARMNKFWQNMFIYVGIWIAVFGMRFLFPLAIVSVTTHVGLTDVMNMALNHPDEYSHRLHGFEYLILMFGGCYLLLLALEFFVDVSRRVHWLYWLEAPLAKMGRLDSVIYLMVTAFVLCMSLLVVPEHALSLMIAGFGSMAIFMAVSMFTAVSQGHGGSGKQVHGLVGSLSLFAYLQVQNSAFSLDSVIGAFAITNDIVLIAAGLGVAALIVMSMTVHLVRLGVFGDGSEDAEPKFRYLEHGAYWAIGALAVCMLLGAAGIHVPEYIIGLSGLVAIGGAVISSIRHNRTVEERHDVFEPVST